jgi:nucleoid-associated protein YgaU
LCDRNTESPEYAHLTEFLKKIREENTRLKAQLAQSKLSHSKAKEQTQGIALPTISTEAYSSERTYVVQHEDSLSKISLKMYGTAVKWRIIYEANRNILPSANSLKIGMRLRIPALKDSQ